MNDDIKDMRDIIGTLPSEPNEVKTEFYRGVEGIKVNLVDYPVNPYKTLFTIATATWGNVWSIGKWATVSPEARLYVVNAVLNRKTLPNAMEGLTMVYEVAGPSRSAFDQIARARIGAVFGSMGWRDNNHSDIGFRVPEAIYADEEKLEAFKRGRLQDKQDYVAMLADQGNWQDARSTLPISALHRWAMAFSYMALTGFMAKRLQFNEQADTVATAWLMREELLTVFPLLGSYCRPASDWAHKCVEHVGDDMARVFGCLFRCSGRFSCDMAGDEYTFNASCADRETLMKQLEIYIPLGEEEMPNPLITLDELAPSDRTLIEAD